MLDSPDSPPRCLARLIKGSFDEKKRTACGMA